MLINLLKETVNVLAEHNKTMLDVLWVGSTGIRGREIVKTRTTVEDFIPKANKDYDNGYGGEEVNTRLILVGKDFWLERAKYGGSEWWEYKEFPEIDKYQEGDVLVFYDKYELNEE